MHVSQTNQKYCAISVTHTYSNICTFGKKMSAVWVFAMSTSKNISYFPSFICGR